MSKTTARDKLANAIEQEKAIEIKKAIEIAIEVEKAREQEMTDYLNSAQAEKDYRDYELSRYTTDELKLELENRKLEQNLYARKDTIDYEMEDGKEIVFDTEDPKCRRFL